MNNRKNVISAVLYQAIHISYGLIIPRLVLGAFGSTMNGLASSIAQFLSFIALLEGGLGAVVLAELYGPIETKDHDRIKGILYSCQSFFRKLAVIYVLYTLVVMVVYSYTMRDQFDVSFVATLVLVLSLTTLAQYLFSITLKLYLQADQKIYITNYITSATLVVNLVFVVCIVNFFPDIRLLYLFGSIAFFVQPLIFRRFIPSEYVDFKENKDIGVELTNRWSGFAQNLAHYVNMNTDIVLITIFCSLADVSVYTVYMLGINALRSIMSYVTNSYQSALGKYIAQGNQEVLTERFREFCVMTWGVCIALYCTCLLVLNPFVAVYTNNVSDANYFQPLFALVMTLANLVFCLREPFRLLILAGGRFKETNFGSIMEAVLNLAVSLVLINFLGLPGVAFGTLIAITYRLCYFIYYLKKDILFIDLRKYMRHILVGAAIVAANVALYAVLKLSFGSMIQFFIAGVIVLVAEAAIVAIFFFGLKETASIVKRLFGRA